MKTITIVIPTYNEESNVNIAYEKINEVTAPLRKKYRFELLFVDNDSTDATRQLIKGLCKKDKRVKAIFNARNFGQARSHFYGLTQAEGDCAVLLHADLQNPPEVILQFISEWEKGSKVVIGIKDNSKENPVLFLLRTVYYKIMSAISDVEQIQHFSDFELLDRDFLNVLRNLHDPSPYLRGIVSELGFKMARVHYSQNRREHGKTTANPRTLYDFAMNGVTSYSKSILRLATVGGFLLSLISIIIAGITFIRKLLYWDSFDMGIAAIGVGVFMLGSVQLFFIGLLGEYILNMNVRILDRPLVIEAERINFEENMTWKGDLSQ